MRWLWRDNVVALVAVVLFAGIFAVRSTDPDPGQTISILYAIPISLVAARWGLGTGLTAGLIAFVLTAVSAWQLQVDIPVSGTGALFLLFMVTGLTVGLLAQRSAGAGQATQHLLAERGEAARAKYAERGEAAREKERGHAVQRLTARLSRAGTTDEVAHAFTVEGLAVLGAVQGGVYLLDAADCLHLLAVARPLEDDTDWTSVPLSARTPPSDAARTNVAIYQRNISEIEAAYPHLRATRRVSGDQAWAAIPLRGSRGVLGAIAAGYRTPQEFDNDHRDVISTVAERVAEAVERARLLDVADAQRARAEAAEQRASLIGDVGAVLTATTGSAVCMQRLTDLLVPRFADLAKVDAVERTPQGPRRDRLAWTCFVSEPLRWPDEASPGMISVPLTARRAVIGHLQLARLEERRHFDQNDILLASVIAGRAALALDNAQLYERQRDVVRTLQHALLPGDLPHVAGVTATARYRPGSAIVDVGGDWYDMIALPDQRVGIVLGDVVGRGVAAAATMGQLRSAVAALAPHSRHPAEVLDRLDAYGATVPGAALATLVYLDYEPGTGLLRYSCAGHPPPLLLDREGTVHRLDQARGVPLSALSGVERPLAQVVIDAPATLICYSDGLIERRGRTIDDSLDDLAAHVEHLHGKTPDEMCDQLLADLAGGSPFGDDIAMLTAELGAASSAGFLLRLPAEPRQLATLRRHLRTWAAGAGLDDRRTGDLLLATGEACANAVEHAYDSGTTSSIEVEVQLGNNGEVTARVSDSGRWREQHAGSQGRGRGLAMINAVMDAVSVSRGHIGTSVHMRQAAR